MHGLIALVLNQLQHNQFMTAAIAATVTGGLLYTLRAIPAKIWTVIKRQITTDVGFNSDIPDYLAAQEFVAKNVVWDSFSRTYLYTTEQGDYDLVAEKRTVEFRGLTLGYGGHIGFWKKRLVFIEREQQQSAQTEKFKERLNMTFFTRNRELVMDFAEQVRRYGQRALDFEAVSLWVNGEGWWKLANRLPNRPMHTVFTTNNEAQQLVDHLNDFKGKRDWYRHRGLPYHTGVLLTGEPGTGKTSLIHAAASATGRSLHYLNLGSVDDDKELLDLVSSGKGWDRAILVIEDADAAGVDVGREPAKGKKKEEKKITLSAMLNLLDGLLTPDGLVVIATSNHPERMDPALLRTGRFDLCLDIGKLDWKAFVNMANVFGFDLSADDPRHADFVPDTGSNLRIKLLEGGVDAVFADD